MADGLIIGGVCWPVHGPPSLPIIPVLNWNDHGKRFAPGDGHNRRRRESIDLCVWHWTGGEREPLGVFDTLRRRKLGVEFCIASQTPVIYQFADPIDVDTPDAGAFNSRSVGVEIPNFGYRRARHFWRRFNREPYQATIHGREHTLARFHHHQLMVAGCLAETLSLALDIPRQVMNDGAGDVFPGVHPMAAAFEGHAGHFQISRSKLDPGLDLLRHLQSRFERPPPPPMCPAGRLTESGDLKR